MCHYRVWHLVCSIQYHPEWIGTDWVHVNTRQNANLLVSKQLTHFARLPIHCMLWFFSGTGWQLTSAHAAHKKTELHAAHEIILMCFLLSCSTQSVTHVQCTKCSSRAVHESWLACSPFYVTYMCWVSHLTKIEEHMSVQCNKCQLRHELYRNL